MEFRERVAHHEAAHAVVAVRLGASVVEQGINLDATTSMEGAYGNAAVNIFQHDSDLSMEEQQQDLMRNLIIVCAGAASDAKLKGKPLREALHEQPGDERVALKLLADSSLTEKEDQSVRQKEETVLLDKALELAEKQLGNPIVWKAIQEVARASLNAGGRLAKPQIDEILDGVFQDSEPAAEV